MKVKVKVKEKGKVKEILIIAAAFFILAAAIGGTSYVSIRLYVNQYIKDNYERRVGMWQETATLVLDGGIVFLGDSLTEFFAIDEFFRDVTTYNRGIYGDTTYGVINRLDESVFNVNPSKVFLLIGANDVNKTKDSHETIAQNIQDIISTIKTNAPETIIYVQSLYPVNRDSPKSNPLEIGKLSNKRIVEINSLLASVCETEQVIYLDLFSHLVDDLGNLREEYTIEGLHLNAQGYKAVAELLRQHIP
ncbi:MAG: GDSL-type esterase/lipase family protein [Peptococcaceae bacterium]|nr:GDSL-type esterase/lipase family protein [Peptococcaceae bacterium]